jgi:hypothetical protein
MARWDIGSHLLRAEAVRKEGDGGNLQWRYSFII